MARRPEIVIFDWGGVFVSYVDILDSAFLAKCSASPDAARNFFTREGPFFELERGNISDADFFEVVKSVLGYQGTFGEFELDFCESMEFKMDTKMFDFLLDFKVSHRGNVSLYILSNICRQHYQYARAKWPGLFSNFFKVFLSFKMGSRKPEEEIFVRALDDIGAKAEDCLFIDDKLANVEAARELGMGALQFTGLVDLRNSLRRFGFNV
ncbi:MAG: HAD family phosphatase [bacterium]|nr:HAD family phosphatase [bacterium]